MDAVDAELGAGGGPYFLGAELSLVECVFAPMLERIAASIPYYKGLAVRGTGCARALAPAPRPAPVQAQHGMRGIPQGVGKACLRRTMVKAEMSRAVGVKEASVHLRLRHACRGTHLPWGSAPICGSAARQRIAFPGSAAPARLQTGWSGRQGARGALQALAARGPLVRRHGEPRDVLGAEVGLLHARPRPAAAAGGCACLTWHCNGTASVQASMRFAPCVTAPAVHARSASVCLGCR